MARRNPARRANDSVRQSWAAKQAADEPGQQQDDNKALANSRGKTSRRAR